MSVHISPEVYSTPRYRHRAFTPVRSPLRSTHCSSLLHARILTTQEAAPHPIKLRHTGLGLTLLCFLTAALPSLTFKLRRNDPESESNCYLGTRQLMLAMVY
ncbi:hypothetical protein RSOLAG1IB_06963 [Rhizoctonia solani AG-1 IB]|uniref:Uncharacterized protein n=1 Tax=Thanatephorus cucumeris (strain AG1-IB / isolate 7/3/14) TaxID=1108050 RepID=A0A0B7FDP6_THACB|nr:hypothetical protein RSOLAG1IB_06963 [Rhizoctonia solani AG-1 IB]